VVLSNENSMCGHKLHPRLCEMNFITCLCGKELDIIQYLCAYVYISAVEIDVPVATMHVTSALHLTSSNVYQNTWTIFLVQSEHESTLLYAILGEHSDLMHYS